MLFQSAADEGYGLLRVQMEIAENEAILLVYQKEPRSSTGAEFDHGVWELTFFRNIVPEWNTQSVFLLIFQHGFPCIFRSAFKNRLDREEGNPAFALESLHQLLQRREAHAVAALAPCLKAEHDLEKTFSLGECLWSGGVAIGIHPTSHVQFWRRSPSGHTSTGFSLSACLARSLATFGAITAVQYAASVLRS